MYPNIFSKFAIDLTMTMLMLVAMAYRITGNTVHEIVGMSIVALFLLHNMVNRRWYQTILKGKYHVFRVLSTAVNLLLLVAMVTLMVSGALISRTVFAFIPLNSGAIARQFHILAAYWIFILTAVHVGIHWEIIIAAMRKMIGMTGANRVRTIAVRLLAVVIAVYGGYASFDRDVGSKLILYYTYEYWDPDKSALVFFAEYLSIMGMYIGGTYSVLKCVQRLKKAKVSNELN